MRSVSEKTEHSCNYKMNLMVKIYDHRMKIKADCMLDDRINIFIHKTVSLILFDFFMENEK